MIRRARSEDLLALLDMERAASSAGLAHVFGPAIPFPDDDVLARWRIVLDDPAVDVLIDEDAGEPVGYAAYGDGWLRHLGVVPSRWATGRGRALHDAAVRGLAAGGAEATYLWVLVGNDRARAFYARLGWEDTGVRDVEVFAPYPEKMQLRRAVGAEERS